MTLPLLQEQSAAGGLMQGLGLGIQQALPSISEMILNRQKQKQIQSILGPIGAQGTAPGGAQGQDLSWKHLLALHAAGAGDIAQTLAPFVASQHKAQIAEQGEERKRERAREELIVASQHKAQIAEQEEERKRERAREELIPIAKELETYINSVGAQPGNLEMAENLDRLGFWYTDKIYTHFNKGVVSKIKFSEIKNKLSPNASASPRVNRARLNALNTIAGLKPNVSSKDFDRAVDKGVKKVDKIAQKNVSPKKGNASSPKALTEDLIMQIFEEAGGDPEKATQLAKDRGYEF